MQFDDGPRVKYTGSVEQYRHPDAPVDGYRSQLHLDPNETLEVLFKFFTNAPTDDAPRSNAVKPSKGWVHDLTLVDSLQRLHVSGAPPVEFLVLDDPTGTLI